MATFASSVVQETARHPEIWIGNVPARATAQQLREALANYSIEVDRCEIKRGRGGMLFAFARLCSTEDFQRALAFRHLISVSSGDPGVRQVTLKIDRSNRSSNVVVGDPNSLAVVRIQAFSVGIFYRRKSVFLQRWEQRPSIAEGKFTINFQKSVMHLCFTPRSGLLEATHDYKLRMHISDLTQVIDVPPGKVSDSPLDRRSSAVILRFCCAPEVYRQDRSSGQEMGARLWVRGDIEEEKDWRRTTNVASFCSDELTLGRYFDYMLVVPNSDHDFQARGMVIDRLLQRSDWGREAEAGEYYIRYEGERAAVAKLQVASSEVERSVMARHIPFDLLFLLEKMVGEGLVYHELLDQEFFRIIHRCCSNVSGTLRVRRALEHFLAKYEVMMEPTAQLCQALQLVEENKDAGRALVAHSEQQKKEHSGTHVPVYRVTVTPLTRYCWGPELDTPNRVLRNYRELSDRFLRVHFTDENFDRLSIGRARDEYSISELLSSVKQKLGRGLMIGDRHFEFLAVSNSQLREHSCWFFASDVNISANDIRQWMGDFRDIRVVAKYAARMGQCFSSTVTTGKLDVNLFEMKEVPDITVTRTQPPRFPGDQVVMVKEYNFSDGIGMISKEFAREAAKSLRMESVPSAYQIRFAGYKGVVALDPTMPPHLKLRLRKSMRKFESSHLKLEVVRAATYQLGHLNREIILLLSALGIKDKVFLALQRRMISEFDQATQKDEVAKQLIDPSNEAGQRLLQMLNGGFSVCAEPFLQAMILAWRRSRLKQLEEKTHIACHNAACLMGVLDESGYLKYGQVFVQIQRDDEEHSPLTRASDYVAIAKNPCLHPGDVRVLKAVFNLPEGHHLNEMVNCVVFPNNGPRPHTDECSGSDLDGDLYFVTWDPDLVPDPKEVVEPMDYSPAPVAVTRQVTMPDIHDFIIKYMQNDQLGSICNWHMAIADLSAEGVKDPRCMKLARQASIAVDYPKTGVPAEKKREWQPASYPDFMKKSDKVTHKSTKVLGKLFHEVQGVFQSDSCGVQRYQAEVLMDTLEDCFDAHLVVQGWEKHKDDALGLKETYDRELRAIMRKYNTFSEAEVIGGFLTELPRVHRRRKLHDVQTFARTDTATLIDGYYREEFLSAPDDLTQAGMEAELEQYYVEKASAWYIVSYNKRYLHWPRPGSRSQKRYPLVSFAWVPLPHLVKLKRQARDRHPATLPWR